MRYILDRMEGCMAVLEREDGAFLDVSRQDLPADVKEGDVLYEQKGRYIKNLSETEERSVRIQQKMQAIWKRKE